MIYFISGKTVPLHNSVSNSKSSTCRCGPFTGALQVVHLDDSKRMCYPIWIRPSGKVDAVNRSSQHSVAQC